MSWIVGLIVKYVLDYLAKLGFKAQKQQESDIAIDEKTKSEAEAIKNAQTDDEFDQAARNSANRP